MDNTGKQRNPFEKHDNKFDNLDENDKFVKTTIFKR